MTPMTKDELASLDIFELEALYDTLDDERHRDDLSDDERTIVDDMFFYVEQEYGSR